MLCVLVEQHISSNVYCHSTIVKSRRWKVGIAADVVYCASRMQRGAPTERDQDVIKFYWVLGTHRRIYEYVRPQRSPPPPPPLLLLLLLLQASAAISTRRWRWTMHCHVNPFSISLLIHPRPFSSLFIASSSVAWHLRSLSSRKLYGISAAHICRRQRLMTSHVGSGDVTAYASRLAVTKIATAATARQRGGMQYDLGCRSDPSFGVCTSSGDRCQYVVRYASRGLAALVGSVDSTCCWTASKRPPACNAVSPAGVISVTADCVNQP